MSEQDIRAERLKKLELLKATGMEAYPAQSQRDTSNADVISEFDALESSAKKLTVGGRVMSIRGQGGIMFVTIFDGTAKLQVVFQKSEMDEALFDFFANA
jgi:lysyl-tRNA synthetase class II